MVERVFRNEIDEMRETKFANIARSTSVLSSMVMALKHNQSHVLSEQLWVNMSSTIKAFSKELPTDPQFDNLKKDQEFLETLNHLASSIEENPKFDQSLVASLRAFLF
jgi:hypothetical protein